MKSNVSFQIVDESLRCVKCSSRTSNLIVLVEINWYFWKFKQKLKVIFIIKKKANEQMLITGDLFSTSRQIPADY